MMEYMRNGGMPMWVMLISAIATVVLAMAWKQRRTRVLTIGSVVQLGLGLFGMALGLSMVSAGFVRFPDKVAALGAGLGEVSNNGTFAGGLAGLLALIAVVAHLTNRNRG